MEVWISVYFKEQWPPIHKVLVWLVEIKRPNSSLPYSLQVFCTLMFLVWLGTSFSQKPSVLLKSFSFTVEVQSRFKLVLLPRKRVCTIKAAPMTYLLKKMKLPAGVSLRREVARNEWIKGGEKSLLKYYWT